MPPSTTLNTRARVDLNDRLIEAEEPLAGFHHRCGGELPGPLVTPALREIVKTAREYGLRLARRLRAQDERDIVTMWVEVEPDELGCSITITNWQTEALQPGQGVAEDDHRIAMARHLADLSVRLGPQQDIAAVESCSAELAGLAKSMADAQGRPWTDFVTLQGNAHRQPLHWRLLDGAKVVFEGLDPARLNPDGLNRVWTATLVPLGNTEPGSDGFELHLVADTPLAEAAPPKIARARSAGLDREIAPVLRQPVSRIIANAETIRTQLAGPLAEEYSNYAADIAAAGVHLLALIDDLTTLELVEDEQFSPAPDQIDLADVARRAAGILGVRAGDRGIVVDAPKVGEIIPAIGEFRRVLQILLNLLGNAIRYSPEGAQVWLRTELADGRARVTVADQGEGLSEQDMARVFEKFERLGRSNSDGGSGLGLYISRRLAHAMDGTLTVESARGQGARFTLDLPEDRSAGGSGPD